MWAAISFDGQEQLYFIEENENTAVYKSILDDCLPDIDGLMNGEFYFMQDNATPHSALERSGYFQDQPFKVLDWPP